MIEISDTQLFGKVIADALVKIDTNGFLNTWEKTRWVNAIAKATAQIEDNDTFMTWQPEKGNTLLIWSDKSNEIYEANGVCQCPAYVHGNPCWHRAAKKLVENYLKATEAVNLPLQPAKSHLTKESCGCVFNWDDKFTEKFCDAHGAEAEEVEAEYESLSSYNNVPYLKMSSDRKPEKVGNIRI